MLQKAYHVSGTVDSNTSAILATQGCVNATEILGPFDKAIEAIAEYRHTDTNSILSELINYTRGKKTPLSQLLQYSLDIAADQYVAEEFYLSDQELMLWLADAGTHNEEVQLRSYMIKNPQIFSCRMLGCDGRIIGGCPKLYCDKCNTSYFLHVDNITKVMCKRCVANELGECTYKTRRKCKDIYGIIENQEDKKDRRH